MWGQKRWSQMAAYKTAIRRVKLSAPMKYIPLVGRVLDYGCGRGFDCDTLQVEGYDPHWRPTPPCGEYDTIYCNYVLNVIADPQEREKVVATIVGLLAPGGVAYISVRNDRDHLNGWTKTGTWQGYVELPYPVVKVTSGFVMYRIEK